MTAGAPDVAGMILPAAILLLTYATIVTERANRAVIALLGAGLVLASGALGQREALAAIDFNTLALLTGMMLIVGIAKKSGLFGYVAIRAAQAMKGSPAGILFALAAVTAVFSALLDNVTTVLLTVPVTLVICAELNVRPYIFLFTQIFASNIGGTATLIGDPPNILIGSAVGLTFTDFVLELTPVVMVIFALQTVINHFAWGRALHATTERRQRLMAMRAAEAIEDHRLLYCSLAVIASVIAAFVFAREIELEAGTIALIGAAVLMLLESIPHPREHHTTMTNAAFHEVEWVTIFFFVGLFVVVGAVQKAGILDLLGHELLGATGGNLEVTTIGILWGAALLSAIVDNIPFVATMIPLIKGMAPALGGPDAILPIWWALALGACLGGNGTLIGASANLTVAGLAERNGVHFRFLTYAKTGFPLMMVSIVMAHIYLVWRFF